MIDFLFATLSLTDKSTLRWCDLYQFILYFFFTLDSLSLSGTHVRSIRTGSYAPGSSGAGNRLLYMCSHELEKFFTFSQGQIWRSCMFIYFFYFILFATLITLIIYVHLLWTFSCAPASGLDFRGLISRTAAGTRSGRYFIYDYYYVPKHSYYILLYIIIITL